MSSTAKTVDPGSVLEIRHFLVTNNTISAINTNHGEGSFERSLIIELKVIFERLQMCMALAVNKE